MSAIITANFSKEDAARIHQSWLDAGYSPSSEHPPHITLIYDGEAESLTAATETLVRNFPLKGTVGGGLVLFSTEDGVAHCSSVNIDGLAGLYTELRESLGDTINLSYDFVPHCTFMFTENVEASNVPEAVEVSITHLVFSGEHDTMVYNLVDGQFESEEADVELDSIDEMEESYVGHVMSLIAAAESVETKTWEAVLAVEGEQTPDGRVLQPGSMRWREGPLTLMMNFEAAHGGQQGGSQIVGVIQEVWRDGNRIMGRGIFDTSAYGQEAYRLVSEGIVSGISIDLAVQDAELIVVEENEYGEPTKVVHSVTDGIILTATITPIQAITSAKIMAMEADSDGMCLQQSERGQDESFEEAGTNPYGSLSGETGRKEIVAAAGRTFKASSFKRPDFTEAAHIRVGEDRTISGHIAKWNSCHIGIEGMCTSAPPSPTDYSFYRIGEVKTDEGKQRVGLITMGIGHAEHDLSARETMDHYDNTDAIAAYVNIGEDAYGIWISGVVAPHLDDDAVTKLSACSLSGDWRLIDGSLELVALLAVNVPGFPVAVMASGQQTALVSAGYFNHEDEKMTTEETTDSLKEVESYEAEDVETLEAEETETFEAEAEEADVEVPEEVEALEAETSEEEVETEVAPESNDFSALIEMFGELVDQVGELKTSLSHVEAYVAKSERDAKAKSLLASFAQ